MNFSALEKKRKGEVPGGHFFVERIFKLSGSVGSLLLGYFRCLECLDRGVGWESLVSQPKSLNIRKRSRLPKLHPKKRSLAPHERLGSMALITTWNAWMQKWCRREIEGAARFFVRRT